MGDLWLGQGQSGLLLPTQLIALKVDSETASWAANDAEAEAEANLLSTSGSASLFRRQGDVHVPPTILITVTERHRGSARFPPGLKPLLWGSQPDSL